MDIASPSLLAYESALYAAGYRTIVGLDEVGRGALAGPIVAAAVVLPPDIALDCAPWDTIRDSKILPPLLRTELALQIQTLATHCAVAEIDAPVIDQIGIGPANRQVMEYALAGIEATTTPDFLLLDAVTIDCAIPQIGIIDGDALSLSIAAASIVAKVHRDAIMTSLATQWPGYGWDRNKGYGVTRHVEALLDGGPCEHHRFSFKPVRQSCIDYHG